MNAYSSQSGTSRAGADVSKLAAGVLIGLKIFFYTIMGILGAVIVGLMAKWPEIAAEIANEKAIADTAGLQPAIILLVAGALVGMWIIVLIINRLSLIVASVREGDPFVRINAQRLRNIGWLLIGLQLWGLIVGALGAWVAEHFQDVNADFSVSLSGLLAVLLCFVLAHVFDQGAALRDELEGTV